GRAMGMIRNGQVFLFATDQLGSVFTVADPSGNSVQEVLYDSFGRRIQNSNPEHDPLLGFCGGLYDSDTGLIHFGYREYDPVIGRFISPDPMGYDGGDVDVYGYCLDDPINFVDRNGLFSNGLCGAFGSGKTNTRAHSSLGANRNTSKNTNHNSSKKGSSHSYGRNGTIGAFGSGNIHGRAHSTLGFNGNRTIGKNTDQNNNSSAKSSVQQAREMEKRAAVIAQKEFQAEKAKLAETKAKRDRTITAAKEREDKIRQMVSTGAIELKNKPTSPLTETVDKAQQNQASMPSKTEGGVGTSTITGKSSAQHSPEMKSLPKATVDKTQQNKGNFVAIGKTAFRSGRLTGRKNKGLLETAGEYISEALDFSHKAYSPLTHPNTKNQASDFIKDKINGGQPAHEPVTNAVRHSWNDMVAKEMLKQQNKNAAASNLKPSSVFDIFSNDPEVRRNRINTIKAGVQGGLKNYVDVQLSTPDTVVAPTIEALKAIDNIMNKNKKK
ncbi:hypothetical protein D0S45_15890, partial [Marinifilum sp. JC120]